MLPMAVQRFIRDLDSKYCRMLWYSKLHYHSTLLGLIAIDVGLRHIDFREHDLPLLESAATISQQK